MKIYENLINWTGTSANRPLAACAGIQRQSKKDGIIENARNEPLTKEVRSHFELRIL